MCNTTEITLFSYPSPEKEEAFLWMLFLEKYLGMTDSKGLSASGPSEMRILPQPTGEWKVQDSCGTIQV